MTALASHPSLVDPAALRRHRYFESDDVDDTRIRISSVLQPHQLEPVGHSGRVRAHMDFVRVGGTTISALAFGTTMDVVVDEMDDYYLFVCALRGHADITSMGERTSIGHQRGASCIPGASFSGRFSADCEQFLMRVDRASMTAHTGIELLRFDHRLALDDGALSPWFAQLQLLAARPDLVALAQRSPLVAAECERLPITLLLAGQPHAAVVPEPRPTGIAPAVVRRAEAWIEAHACEPLRLGDIAAAVGVPVRTLLDGFQRFRGTSPMQQVRQRRLERARARLLEAGPSARVGDIALDCGFAHFGRFSQAYRAQFGESPSCTLRRRP